MIPPRHDRTRGLGVGVGLALALLIPGLALVTMRLGESAIPIWIVAVAGVAFVSRGPIGQAIAARIHPRVDEGDQEAIIPPELYAELDELRGRIAELEERQDFSERLLSTRTEPKEPE